MVCNNPHRCPCRSTVSNVEILDRFMVLWSECWTVEEETKIDKANNVTLRRRTDRTGE
jgi:hypothetical protein